ncbi:MAG: serine hydrolase, partial [Limisphaerales bacterium]
MSSTWFQSHRFPLGPSLALLLGVSALSLPGATPAKPAPPPKAAPKKTPQSAPAKPSASISRNPYIGAIAIDADTGRVLVEDKADAQGYPASMLKLMGLYLHLEKLKRGELALQDRVQVSARAAKTGGSQVWLAEKEVFSVE